MCWRRDRLPIPVFLGFPCGSAGKESTCNTKNVGWIPGLGRSQPTPEFWPEEFHGLYSSWGHKESDMTERLSLSLFLMNDNYNRTTLWGYYEIVLVNQ